MTMGFGGTRQRAIVVAKVSGQVVAVLSGVVAISSGTVIAKVSGTVAVKSGIFVVSSGTVVVQSGKFVITSGTVIAKVSGTVAVKSGIFVVSSGTVVVASGVVAISSGVVVAKVSGEVVQPIVPTMVKTGFAHMVKLSGGEVLHSGAVKAVLVKALSTNSGYILIGGSGNRPFWGGSATSSQGLLLAAGESESKDISDFKWIYVAAQNSGNVVCFDGVY